MNVIAQMNSAQMETSDDITKEPQVITTHNYNLRPRWVKPRQQLNPLKIDQQSILKAHSNPHKHAMPTQMRIKAGIKSLDKEEVMH